MKRRAFLLIGVIIVATILLLQREGMSREMKSIIFRFAHLIESGARIVYKTMTPLVMTQPIDV